MLPIYGSNNDGIDSNFNDSTTATTVSNLDSRRRRRPERRGHGNGKMLALLVAGLLVWTFGAIVFRGENIKTHESSVIRAPYRTHIISKENKVFAQNEQQIRDEVKGGGEGREEGEDDNKDENIQITKKENEAPQLHQQKEQLKTNEEKEPQQIQQKKQMEIDNDDNDNDEDDDNDDDEDDDDEEEDENKENKKEKTNIKNVDDYEDEENIKRRNAILDAMKKSWGGYVKYAWGTDELQPESKKGHDWLGLGATIIDSLDTLWLMGMKDEFARGRDWVRDEFDFRVDMNVSFFETTIRVLGGLLSAYALSDDKVFLTKAEELGSVLLRASTDTPLGLPYGQINLATGATSPHKWMRKKTILADIGSVQLEFLYLSILTGNGTYAKQMLRIYDTLFEKNPNADGLYYVIVDPNTGICDGKMITIGALGDSFYEYLLKLWIFAGGPRTPEAGKYRTHYDRAVAAIQEKLVQQTATPAKLTYISEMRKSGAKKKAMDHLCCFAGGMFALGTHKYGNVALPESEEHLKLGAEVTRTCHEMYARSPTKLAPEAVIFETNNAEMVFKAKYDLIRPETVESYFYMWRKTHDIKYREWGWEMFQAFREHCETDVGFSGVKDVTQVPPEKDDKQPSWFLAETLKYMYLLFSPDDVISLDDYVFNTEAHPFPIQKQDIRKYFIY